MLRRTFLATLAATAPFPARAASFASDAPIRRLIEEWYARAKAGESPFPLIAASAVLDWPKVDDCGPQPAYVRPRPPFELAALALKFDYEIHQLTANADLAKAVVWERGWFYAWAAEKTYQTAVRTTFVFEKDRDGTWKVLAHAPNSIAIHPDHADDPMPDLKPLWEAQQSGAK